MLRDASLLFIFFVFFFNDTATTEIYTLSLHDALPIWVVVRARGRCGSGCRPAGVREGRQRRRRRAGARRRALSRQLDRKSTRLNSSHANISYAVFCLKKKKKCTLTIDRLSQSERDD